MNSNDKELYMYVDKSNKRVKHIKRNGTVYVPLDRVGGVKKIYKMKFKNSNIEDYYKNPDDYIVEEINKVTIDKASGSINKDQESSNIDKYKVNIDTTNRKVYMYVDRFYKTIKDFWIDKKKVWIPVERVTDVDPIYKRKLNIDTEDYHKNPLNYIEEEVAQPDMVESYIQYRNMLSVDILKNKLNLQTELHDGDMVKIMRESNGFLYVTTKFLNHLCNSIQSHINKNIIELPLLKSEPKPGDLVAAFYVGQWYRAVVIAVDEYDASIIYIDYGYEDVQEWQYFKVLTDIEKLLPLTLFKVKLKGFSEFSHKQLDYLNKLKTDRTELVVNFDGDFEDGVHLITKTEGNISIKLTELKDEVYDVASTSY